jgi:acetyl-CoA acetyltransferase
VTTPSGSGSGEPQSGARTERDDAPNRGSHQSLRGQSLCHESNFVLCAPVRTAIGTYGGSLKDLAAPVLGSVVIKETLSRGKIDGNAIDTVVMGQIVQAGAKMNPARQAAIKAGVPVNVPAMTINRVCGSGAQAIAMAAQEIMLGFVRRAVAGVVVYLWGITETQKEREAVRVAAETVAGPSNVRDHMNTQPL